MSSLKGLIAGGDLISSRALTSEVVTEGDLTFIFVGTSICERSLLTFLKFDFIFMMSLEANTFLGEDTFADLYGLLCCLDFSFSSFYFRMSYDFWMRSSSSCWLMML